MGDLIKFGLKWIIAPIALLTVALSAIEGVWDTATQKGEEGEGVSEQFLGETVENIGENTKAMSKRVGEGLGIYDREKGVISLDEAVKKGSKFGNNISKDFPKYGDDDDEQLVDGVACDRSGNNPFNACIPD